jgi:adenosylcobinamide-GDP ribazoletransferase
VDRRIEVMAEPGVGAFGVGVGAAAVVLRLVALDATAPSVLLLAGLWCASRTLMATAAVLVPYARREGGLASSFLGARRNLLPVVAPGTGASIALLLAWNRRAGGVVIAAALVGGVAVVALARRRLGGFTGDVLGAAGVVAETLGLVVAAARW